MPIFSKGSEGIVIYVSLRSQLDNESYDFGAICTFVTTSLAMLTKLGVRKMHCDCRFVVILLSILSASAHVSAVAYRAMCRRYIAPMPGHEKLVHFAPLRALAHVTSTSSMLITGEHIENGAGSEYSPRRDLHQPGTIRMQKPEFNEALSLGP